MAKKRTFLSGPRREIPVSRKKKKESEVNLVFYCLIRTHAHKTFKLIRQDNRESKATSTTGFEDQSLMKERST